MRRKCQGSPARCNGGFAKPGRVSGAVGARCLVGDARDPLLRAAAVLGVPFAREWTRTMPRGQIQEAERSADRRSVDVRSQHLGRPKTVIGFKDVSELDGSAAGLHRQSQAGRGRQNQDHDQLSRHFSGPASSAKSDTLRRSMLEAWNTRAYPKNRDVLIEMMRTRYQIATLIGLLVVGGLQRR